MKLLCRNDCGNTSFRRGRTFLVVKKLRLETDEVAERLSDVCSSGAAAMFSYPADGHSLIRYPAIRRWLVGNLKFAMITKFDSLYAGHTDLDNIGIAGRPSTSGVTRTRTLQLR
jgi:hypothetical protein